ncbi:MAG: hypothetical protein R3A10_14700 [Caldilineaceae bacterium]
MSHPAALADIGRDPEQLELTYRRAASTSDAAAFAAAIDRAHADAPSDPHSTAWHYRLAYAATQLQGTDSSAFHCLGQGAGARRRQRRCSGSYPIPPGCSTAKRPRFSSSGRRSAGDGVVLLAWAGTPRWPVLAADVVALVLLAGFARAACVWLDTEQLHQLLPATDAYPCRCWPGPAVGIYLLWAYRRRCRDGRFCSCSSPWKRSSYGGSFAIAGGIFVAVTIRLFQALGIELAEWMVRVLVAGGGGLVLPLLAVAIVYDHCAAGGNRSPTGSTG